MAAADMKSNFRFTLDRLYNEIQYYILQLSQEIYRVDKNDNYRKTYFSMFDTDK